jgi:hypothetical protein
MPHKGLERIVWKVAKDVVAEHGDTAVLGAQLLGQSCGVCFRHRGAAGEVTCTAVGVHQYAVQI